MAGTTDQGRRTLMYWHLIISSTLAYNNGVARTPPLGWNSWCTDSLCNAFGKDPCSEHMVTTTADAFVSEGLRDLGYNYVTLDDCWSAKTRNATGHLMADATLFPNGMKHVADYVHARGLRFGLYTCVGTKTCKGDRPGSYGYYERDAQTLAEWGVDFVKMDHCGMVGTGNHTDQELYGRMSRALNATGRPILFSLCQWGLDDVWTWGADVAQMYRVQMDHLPFFDLPSAAAGAGIGQGTLQIVEWMAKLVPSRWTKAYGYMDPDFLMTLYPTMDFTASRTEFSFWAVWSAPLLVATDLRRLSSKKRAILANPEVLSINQDASYTAADRVRNDSSTGAQLWARPLANGDWAVLLYNGNRWHHANLSVSWEELPPPHVAVVEMGSRPSSCHVRDLWRRRDLGVFTGGYTAAGVAPHDVALLRVTPR